jgi:hypothetical protein
MDIAAVATDLTQAEIQNKYATKVMKAAQDQQKAQGDAAVARCSIATCRRQPPPCSGFSSGICGSG